MYVYLSLSLSLYIYIYIHTYVYTHDVYTYIRQTTSYILVYAQVL